MRRRGEKAASESGRIIWRAWVRFGVGDGPEFGHDPAYGYADDAAEQYFGDAASAELHSGELGMLFQTGSDDNGGGDRRLAEHNLHTHDVGRDERRGREGDWQFPFVRGANNEDKHADSAADQRIDHAAVKRFYGRLHHRIACSDHGADGPDGIEASEFADDDPKYSSRDEDVCREMEARPVAPKKAIQTGVHLREQ